MTGNKKNGKQTPKSIKKFLDKINRLRTQKEKELRIIDGLIIHIKRQCPHTIVKDPHSKIAVCSICGSQLHGESEMEVQVDKSYKEHDAEIEYMVNKPCTFQAPHGLILTGTGCLLRGTNLCNICPDKISTKYQVKVK